jgi:hypothetical protein
VYYNAKLIFQKGEVWRLLTNFMFFGNLGAAQDGWQAGAGSSKHAHPPPPPTSACWRSAPPPPSLGYRHSSSVLRVPVPCRP